MKLISSAKGAALSRHPARRAGRHAKGLAGLVAALFTGDARPDRALQDLEALVLAGVQVLGRPARLGAVGRLHLQELAACLGGSPDEAQDVAAGPVQLLAGLCRAASIRRDETALDSGKP